MYKVVVVEDEEIARKGIIFTINWEALNCMIAGEAANGEEGAEVIRRLSPDIIVTDLKMPRMDGVEMIAKLREQGNRAKFIILTAYGDFKYAQSAVKLGVSDYLLKRTASNTWSISFNSDPTTLKEIESDGKGNRRILSVYEFRKALS